jgi:hypothetical protein
MRTVQEIKTELERVETEIDKIETEDEFDDVYDSLSSRKWALKWVLGEEE